MDRCRIINMNMKILQQKAEEKYFYILVSGREISFVLNCIYAVR